MRNRSWIKHICALFMVLCFGFLAAGSLETSAEFDEKAVEQYKAGNIEKARKMFNKGSIKEADSIHDLDKPSRAVQCYYYSKLLEKDGKNDDALKYKLLVYEHAVKYTNLRESYKDIYKEVMNNKEIQKLVSSQQEKKIKNSYSGTWKRYSISDSNSKSVSESSIASNTPVPDTCVIKSDGTGYFKVSGGRTDSFTWSVPNGKMEFSCEFPVFVNHQGYIVYQQWASVRGSLKRVNVFFKK
ncbi:MAG: hypothetical protein KBT11_10610 [Treponema sp.]|nr:hypothetical protein [Candidatus Treponema equifaecale]